jgi:hypothetical protein
MADEERKDPDETVVSAEGEPAGKRDAAGKREAAEPDQAGLSEEAPPAGNADGYADDATVMADRPPIDHDETTRLTPEDLQRHRAQEEFAPGADHTRVMPPADAAPAWAGRAGVPVTPPPVPPLRDAGVTGYQELPPQGGRTWWTPLLLGLLALGLIGIVGLSAWLFSRDNEPDPASSPTIAPTTGAPSPTASPSALPSVSASPSASPAQLVQVPAGLVGLSQNQASSQLQAVGLFFSLEFQPSQEEDGTVIEVKPAEGELVPAGTTVTLVIAFQQGNPSPSTPAPSPSDDD